MRFRLFICKYSQQEQCNYRGRARTGFLERDDLAFSLSSDCSSFQRCISFGECETETSVHPQTSFSSCLTVDMYKANLVGFEDHRGKHFFQIFPFMPLQRFKLSVGV